LGVKFQSNLGSGGWLNMKLRFASLSLLALCLMLAAAPAVAQIYSNGPTNGNLYAWNINSEFVVSDTFNVNNAWDFAVVQGASFSMWLYPGDVLSSAELSITSSENGGTSYFDQYVNFNSTNCQANQYGFNVCTETTYFENYNAMTNGTYWVNLKNASVTSGDPVYWDENFGGPSSYALGQSLASENTVGTIPSESFTLYGVQTYVNNSTTTVPEPSSIMLIGSGILGLAGMLRRKLF
jgi:hypothetical protein